MELIPPMDPIALNAVGTIVVDMTNNVWPLPVRREFSLTCDFASLILAQYVIARLKGDSPVLSFGIVRYAQSTLESSSNQQVLLFYSFLVTLDNFFVGHLCLIIGLRMVSRSWPIGFSCILDFFSVVPVTDVSTSVRKSAMICPLIDSLDPKGFVYPEMYQVSMEIPIEMPLLHRQGKYELLKWRVVDLYELAESCEFPIEALYFSELGSASFCSFEGSGMFRLSCNKSSSFLLLRTISLTHASRLGKTTHIRHVPLLFLTRTGFATQRKIASFLRRIGVAYCLRPMLRSASSMGTSVMFEGFQGRWLMMTLCSLRVSPRIGSYMIYCMLVSSTAAAKLVSLPGSSLQTIAIPASVGNSTIDLMADTSILSFWMVVLPIMMWPEARPNVLRRWDESVPWNASRWDM
ncbi:hypothetical protein Tco_0705230 [Tanacetum coccineum]|uniref:Uncharacterized protein n=1 Tax=Tanacetum coccineum TaxID=301880 RepID=A0ABQ4Y428_9ASTR